MDVHEAAQRNDPPELEAELELTNAEKDGSIEALTKAISQAEQAGVGNMALTRAENRLQVLTEDKKKQEAEDAAAQVLKQAEQALKKAAEEENTEALTAAISEAEQAGVNKEALTIARKKLE